MKQFIITVLVLLAIFLMLEYIAPDLAKNYFGEKTEVTEEVIEVGNIEGLEEESVENTNDEDKVVKPVSEELVEDIAEEVAEEDEDTGGHLKFKGIAIKGTMDSFCKKLKAKGFTQIGREGKAKLFEGDFTGKTATVKVESDNDGKNVYRVIVMFTPSQDWNELIEVYNYYKDIYTKKYGNTSYQKHRNPQATDSNISAMYELWQGTVTWASRWKDTGGTIEISIEKTNGISEGVVVIRYSDSQNEAAKIQSDLDEI